MGSLLVVTGPPGAGKSTIARLLAQRSEQSVVVEGDAFFGFLATGAVEPWLPESHEQNTIVTRAAAAAAGAFTTGGYTTVFDGVVGPWFLPTFAKASGLETFDYVVLMPPVDVCVLRVRNRRDHGFRDEEAARKMHSEFASSGIADSHLLDEVDTDPGTVATAIEEARAAGRLTYAVG